MSAKVFLLVGVVHNETKTQKSQSVYIRIQKILYSTKRIVIKSILKVIKQLDSTI